MDDNVKQIIIILLLAAFSYISSLIKQRKKAAAKQARKASAERATKATTTARREADGVKGQEVLTGDDGIGRARPRPSTTPAPRRDRIPKKPTPSWNERVEAAEHSVEELEKRLVEALETRVQRLFGKEKSATREKEAQEQAANPTGMSVSELAEMLRNASRTPSTEGATEISMPGDLYAAAGESADTLEAQTEDEITMSQSPTSTPSTAEEEENFHFNLRDAMRYQAILGPRGGWRNQRGASLYRG